MCECPCTTSRHNYSVGTKAGNLLNALSWISGGEVDELCGAEAENEIAFIRCIDPDDQRTLCFCVLD